mmetsp:Transcript_28512/g.51515  ORF Transcript_28512/g.51515 Transcript_28512/m.51515 type:complete len:458 (+) Transcript_28512:75-1448(+)|eukprot:CAMPEP_0201946856 /NCGR_PEP_ID=MMETSP0903-20130614/54635_1 /ASSEMBLY_ACC=CAM_ASM_000552 /TAXON_ID=420261 /ORGANISM="Thalassiosira antarctica, Strain CCMP982" /LENGTH=457 /DNA_ID=CAMNT_0048489967 /DNA_START=30 /DNA_END=1403 /DNA_ORIENTATION=-
MANDYRNQHQQQPPAADISPRRTAGLHAQQPTRIKSFFRQNQNSNVRKILLPLVYLFLSTFYFYNLLFRDVGSGVHVLKDNININVTHASAPVWNSPESDPAVVKLEPRSLADVSIANAEVAWKRQVDYQNYLRRRAEMWEEQLKKQEEAARLAKLEKENGTVIDADAGEHDGNETEQLILLNLSNSSHSETAEEYVTRLTNLSSRRMPKRRKIGQHSSSSQKGADVGFLPVLFMMALCTTFRIFVSLLIGRTAANNFDSLAADSDDAETRDNNTTPTTGLAGRAGLSSFVSGLGGGREAARLRRRARAVRAHRQFQRFVDRLNAERESNGEREISADTLRHLINSRDFNGNDYDRLSSFVEESGPAMGSIFSYIGATEAEINRCPSRSLGANDELLRPTQVVGDQQHQTCAVCLEPYQVGETVRTIPCFHTFHKACIDPWLAQRAECPICKHSAIG